MTLQVISASDSVRPRTQGTPVPDLTGVKAPGWTGRARSVRKDQTPSNTDDIETNSFRLVPFFELLTGDAAPTDRHDFVRGPRSALLISSEGYIDGCGCHPSKWEYLIDVGSVNISRSLELATHLSSFPGRDGAIEPSSREGDEV